MTTKTSYLFEDDTETDFKKKIQADIITSIKNLPQINKFNNLFTLHYLSMQGYSFITTTIKQSQLPKSFFSKKQYFRHHESDTPKRFVDVIVGLNPNQGTLVHHYDPLPSGERINILSYIPPRRVQYKQLQNAFNSNDTETTHKNTPPKAQHKQPESTFNSNNPEITHKRIPPKAPKYFNAKYAGAALIGLVIVSCGLGKVTLSKKAKRQAKKKPYKYTDKSSW